jgi:multiple sugar transport system substrate-binding protein
MTMTTGGHDASRREFLKVGGAAALSLSGLAALAGCGGGGGGSATAKGTVSYIKGPHSTNDLVLQQQLAAEFKKAHPEITVKPALYDWSTSDTKLTAAYASPNPPDVAYLVTAVFPKFADAGAIMDLTDRVKASDFSSEYKAYSQGSWDAATYKDKIWGVPLFGAVFPQYTNETLLGDHKDSWHTSYASMREAAIDMRKGKNYGFSIGTTVADEAYQYLATYIHNAGGTLFNEDLTGGGLDRPEVVDAFELLRQIHMVDRSAPAPGLYDTEGRNALFKAGRIGLLGTLPIIAAEMSAKAPKFDYDVKLIPPGPAAQTCGGDYGFLCVAENAKDPDAAWEYVKFLSSQKRVSWFLEKTGKTQQALRGDVAESLYGNEKSIQRTMQKDFVGAVQTYSVHPRQKDALRVLVTEFELLLRGRKSAKQMVGDANEQITRLAR